jgi:DNA-binding FrmR family transcriptional regulator
MPRKDRLEPETATETCSPGRDLLMEADILDRLKRIEGQVRGIQKMIQERRNCNDIIIQLAAVKAAVTRVSLTVLNCHLAESISKDLREGRDIKESLAESMAIFKKFS